MKKCPTCGQLKSLECFAKRNDRKSGVQSRCKECNKALRPEPCPPDLTLTERRCSKCEMTKPIAEFSLNKSMVGGYNWWCKACHSASNRGHYAENIEEEHVKGKEKRERRRPKRKIYHAGWYAKNKEPKDVQNKQWFKEHPGMHAQYVQTYRARMNDAPLNDLTDEQFQEILAACGHRCPYCPANCVECRKKTHVFEREHLTPVSKGGSYTLANILPSCLRCNRRKHNGPPPVPVQPFLLTVAPSKQAKPKKISSSW